MRIPVKRPRSPEEIPESAIESGTAFMSDFSWAIERDDVSGRSAEKA
jgi:hypothetical protein